MRKWISTFVRSFVKSDARQAHVAEAVEGLEDRKLFASSLAYGINANAVSKSSYPHIVGMLRDTGTKTIRLWLSTNFSKNETGVFKYIRKFKADGFDTTVTIDNDSRPGFDTIKSWAGWAADTLGGSVDRWQVGNEVDKEYGDLRGYVNNFLKPAYEGLHSRGEKVVSGSVTWNPDDVREMASYGMLNYCDMVGYHPYRPSVAALKSAVAEVKEIADGKPLVATEWNVRGKEGNKDAWNDAIKEYWPTIRDNFYAAYYFAAVKVNTMAGPSGTITSGGGRNGEFYDTYKSLKHNYGGDGDVDEPTAPTVPTRPTTPTTPTTPDDDDVTNGNTPQSGAKPSIGGFKVINAATGATILNNVTSGQTISLASLNGQKIQIQALTSSNTSSVKFGFTGRATRTENTAPFTAFGDANNRETAWTATKGNYTLWATAYTSDNAGGTSGNTLSVSFKFA